MILYELQLAPAAYSSDSHIVQYMITLILILYDIR